MDTIEHPSSVAKPFFRDTLQTVDEKGRRKWIYPKRPSGKLYRQRWVVALILLAFFVAAPFISVNGEPLMLFNVLQRKFIILGQVFWPQDFHLLVLSIIAFLVFIILFTVIFGRLFCGWACPQTIFMEFVFRQIEYLIEGDHHTQRKLDQQEWDFEKLWKKGLKHTLFILLSLGVIHLITAYIIGASKLGELMNASPVLNFGTFMAVMVFSALFYGVFAFFREQVCILVCPYGRLQGVLLDEKSIVVAYDYKRGEARGSFHPGEDRLFAAKGDCIDCNNCVMVCPTGIDIRNGTQLECINCTACIDACKKVMERVKSPRGLIRYDSEEGIVRGIRRIFSGRAMAYSAFLLVLLGVVTTLFVLRGDVETTILRMPGSLYQKYGADSFANIYKVQLVNKTNQDMPITLEILSPAMGKILWIGPQLQALQGQVTEADFMVVFPENALSSSNTKLIIGVFAGDKQVDTYKTNFIAPNRVGIGD